jgi:hypothetical protein
VLSNPPHTTDLEALIYATLVNSTGFGEKTFQIDSLQVGSLIVRYYVYLTHGSLTWELIIDNRVQAADLGPIQAFYQAITGSTESLRLTIANVVVQPNQRDYCGTGCFAAVAVGIFIGAVIAVAALVLYRVRRARRLEAMKRDQQATAPAACSPSHHHHLYECSGAYKQVPAHYAPPSSADNIA